MTTFYVDNIMHNPERDIELLKRGFPESNIEVSRIYDKDPFFNPRTGRPWKYPRFIFDSIGDEKGFSMKLDFLYADIRNNLITPFLFDIILCRSVITPIKHMLR